MPSTDKMCCGDVRSDLLMLFSPLKIDLIICPHCGEKHTHTHTHTDTHTHTQRAEETVLLSSSVFIFWTFFLLPHFRSAPQHLQLADDTYHRLLPLAWCFAGDRRTSDGAAVRAITSEILLCPWETRTGPRCVSAEAVSAPPTPAKRRRRTWQKLKGCKGAVIWVGWWNLIAP